MYKFLVKFLIIFILAYSLFITKPAIAAKASVIDGEIGFGYSRNEANHEMLDLNIDIEVTKENVGIKFKNKIDKEHTKDKLIRMNVLSGVQIKAYIDEAWATYIYGDFQYEQQMEAGIDSKTLAGIGLGTRSALLRNKKSDYEIQGGLYVASKYIGTWVDETPLVKLNGDVEIHLHEIHNVPIYFDADASLQAPLEDIDFYIFRSDSGIRADLDDQFFAKLGIDYDHINKPSSGRSDFHKTYIKFGVTW